MQVFLVKKKKPERDDVPVNPLVFPENDKHNEDIFFSGVSPTFLVQEIIWPQKDMVFP